MPSPYRRYVPFARRYPRLYYAMKHPGTVALLAGTLGFIVLVACR